MTDISNIKSLLDWQLLKGSHTWPGPDGGTCINEVAIVVAGCRYQEVTGPEDLPRSFSRELGILLLCLNDSLSDEHRQELKRFVLRLPGSRDSVSIEVDRMKAVRSGLVRLLAERALPTVEMATLQFGNIFERISSAQVIASRIAVVSESRGSAFLEAALGVIERAFEVGRKADRIDTRIVEERLAMAREPQDA